MKQEITIKYFKTGKEWNGLVIINGNTFTRAEGLTKSQCRDKLMDKIVKNMEGSQRFGMALLRRVQKG